LHKLYLAGLPTPRPYGVVELSPEREYLLVTEFFDGAVELGDAEVDDQVIDEGLQIIRKLWAAGLAHRDIKPANLLVRDGHLLLIDVFFAEVRPTPWRQAVDLANMMLCLALRSNPERVYQRALHQFSDAEISEGFAAARGLALPSQLRRMLRDQGRDLHAEFVSLLPARPHPIRIQRWSGRRVGLLLLMVPVAVLLVPTVRLVLFNDDPNVTRLEIHDLGCERLETLWLQAQSVPSASRVPCVRSLPGGRWPAPTPATAGRNSPSTTTGPATGPWSRGSPRRVTLPGEPRCPPPNLACGTTSRPSGSPTSSPPPGMTGSRVAASPTGSSPQPTPKAASPPRRHSSADSSPARRSNRHSTNGPTGDSPSTQHRSEASRLALETSIPFSPLPIMVSATAAIAIRATSAALTRNSAATCMYFVQNRTHTLLLVVAVGTRTGFDHVGTQ
jgi:tRNA A-37 threonylcarbamoyl transferase component Bud32